MLFFTGVYFLLLFDNARYPEGNQAGCEKKRVLFPKPFFRCAQYIVAIMAEYCYLVRFIIVNSRKKWLEIVNGRERAK